MYIRDFVRLRGVSEEGKVEGRSPFRPRRVSVLFLPAPGSRKHSSRMTKDDRTSQVNRRLSVEQLLVLSKLRLSFGFRLLAKVKLDDKKHHFREKLFDTSRRQLLPEVPFHFLGPTRDVYSLSVSRMRERGGLEKPSPPRYSDRPRVRLEF